MPTANERALTLQATIETKLTVNSKNIMNPLHQARQAMDIIIERDGVVPIDKSTGEITSPERVLQILNAQEVIVNALP